MEGTGANLRLPLNPPFFFESAVELRQHDRRRHASAPASPSWCPGTTPSGNVRAYDPDLRPQFTQQWNAFVEYRLTSTHVGAGRIRRPPRRSPGHAGRRQPGAAWRRRSVDVGAQEHAAAAVRRAAAHHDHRDDAPRGRAANTTRCRPAFASGCRAALEFLASYTLGKVTTNNRGFYGIFGGTGLQGVTSATEGAYWQNTYDPEAEWGPAFHDVRHNFVFSSTYELPFGRGKAYGDDWSGVMNAVLGGWRVGGIFQARSGLPITVIDGRARSLQGERGSERPNCVGDLEAGRSVDQSVARHHGVRSRAARHLRQLPGRRGSRAGILESRPDAGETHRCRRHALRRIPDRGIQRPESSELRTSGTRHLGAGARSGSSRTRSARRESSSSCSSSTFSSSPR